MNLEMVIKPLGDRFKKLAWLEQLFQRKNCLMNLTF